MSKLENIKPGKVFKYFEEICAIPHGSGNMDKISEYCMSFAEKHGLRAIRDKANNVIIYKEASLGYEDADTVILQGHLDMVCQKDEGVDIDFESDSIQAYIDGDYIKAKGTTLGGDNGIAVAMIMAILEDNTLRHPAIEAVFTTDEEIGMIGAGKLDFSLLKGKKMINIDSEDQDVLTVSCAGGSDFKMILPLSRLTQQGTAFEITVKGLKGGHSGVEINSGRVNADILMARILNYARSITAFGLIGIDGGTKDNAIPVLSTATIVPEKIEGFAEKLRDFAEVVSKEISFREEDFQFDIEERGEGCFEIIAPDLANKITDMLISVPNGVMEMSAEIENLVETSLNLGILKTEPQKLTAHFALRSNKSSALKYLEDRMKSFACLAGCTAECGGHYPPWEFKKDSALQSMYRDKYREKLGREISVEAIHAGLECGVFSANLEGLDCISVGPKMYDIHTTGERLSISSVGVVFDIITKVLSICR